jgi:hypothetical protein
MSTRTRALQDQIGPHRDVRLRFAASALSRKPDIPLAIHAAGADPVPAARPTILQNDGPPARSSRSSGSPASAPISRLGERAGPAKRPRRADICEATRKRIKIARMEEKKPRPCRETTQTVCSCLDITRLKDLAQKTCLVAAPRVSVAVGASLPAIVTPHPSSTSVAPWNLAPNWRVLPVGALLCPFGKSYGTGTIAKRTRRHRR